MTGELALELWLPYGKTEIPVRVPDDNFFRIVEPRRSDGARDISNIVNNALDNPTDEHHLKEFVKPGAQAGIIVDPLVPIDARRESVKLLTSRLSALGVDTVKVFSRKRMSSDISDDSLFLLDPLQNSFTEIGKTAMGTPVDLDPALSNCELKIMVSLTLPHFATGFVGGPEAVIPSSSSIRSIARNRSLLTKGLPEPVNTVDNAVLMDSLEACKIAGPIYSISFLPDGLGGVVEAVAGELEPVFRRAVARYLELHSTPVERKLDIVIVSAGSLMGSDLYHATRVVSNVLGAVRKGGTVILVAECSRGIGDNTFLDYARRFPERKDLANELRHRFKLGGHVNLYLEETLERCRIQLVSVLPELFVRDTFRLKPSQTASESVQKAIRLEGKDSKILIVPRGDITIPVMESSQTKNN
jgi:lactate racemase